MEIQIVQACAADAQAILEAKIDAFSWDVDTYGFGPPGFDSIENQIKAFDNPEISFFKLLADGKVIGGASVFDKTNGHYHLGGIYIKNAYQNKGIGQKVLMRIMAQFPDAVKWTLETPYKSLRNHYFYEKLGFKKIGETEPEENGFFLFVYEKVL